MSLTPFLLRKATPTIHSLSPAAATVTRDQCPLPTSEDQFLLYFPVRSAWATGDA